MEIKPRLVLQYPDGTLIYVYKCREGKSWLEFTPETSDPVGFWQSKNKDDYDPEEDDELDCVVVNIKNEQEFMVKNLDYIIDPPKKIQDYMWHSRLLQMFYGASMCIEVVLLIAILST